MTTPTRHTRGDRAADQAADWFVRLQGEAATEDDWQAFARWVETPANAAAYARLERLSVELDADASAIAKLLDAPKGGARRARPGGAPRPVTRRAWIAGGGAIAAGVVIGVVVLASRGPVAPPATVYQAAAGQTQSVRLADGTQLRINAASSLKVSLGADARRVEMADAEAAFDVTHDPNRPFLITVGDAQVRVVGTEFNIRHRAGAMELTVRRGVVEVHTGGEGSAPYRVAAGQQLAHRDGAASASVASANASDAFAWTEGQLVYRDRPLAEVAQELSRRFGHPISTDTRAAGLRFTGVLVTDSEPAVLRRLESFAPVRAERTANGVVLRGR